ncbi:MAG: zinc metalloprotease HtpX [Negativicutes bacterium]
MNNLKTTFLLVLLTVILMMVGQAFGGRGGMTLMLFVSLGINLVSYWYSDKIVLSMYKARQITREQAPDLFNIVAQLAASAELPMPKVYVIDSDTPNAFATGRSPQHAAVAVTTGIIRVLDKDELEAVLAHELAHVKHHDTLIGTMVASIAGVITWISTMAQWAMIFGGRGGDREEGGGILGSLFMIILAPIAATLVQLAISRSREFEADYGAAKISGKPLALADALRKIEQSARFGQLSQTVSPATAHMFIINPLSGGNRAFASLFSTHPPTEQRVARLIDIAQKL